MQVTRGVYRFLSIPSVYQTWKKLLRSEQKRQLLFDEYVRPKLGDRVLDIGCGTGDALPKLGAVVYHGIDASESYIADARAKYGDRGSFSVGLASQLIDPGERFDLILALGLLHHLDDGEVRALFDTAKSLLAPGGRLVTYDGVYVENQSPVARFFLSRDRGRNVRWKDDYEALAYESFGPTNVVSHICDNLLRIPYTHLIMECSGNTGSTGKPPARIECHSATMLESN